MILIRIFFIGVKLDLTHLLEFQHSNVPAGYWLNVDVTGTRTARTD